MNHIRCAFSACIMTLAAAASTTNAPVAYPIACWTYMRFEEQTRPVEQIVKDWKDLGINLPIMPVTSGKTDKAAVLIVIAISILSLPVMVILELASEVIKEYGAPFGEVCYWVSDGSSYWVCTEALLERRAA